MKIWIVKNAWSYDGNPDDYSNCYEETIEDVFDSESKAIKYIQDELRPMVERRAAVLAVRNSINKAECRRKKCEHCIGCEDIVDLDEVPTEEFIKEHKDEIIYHRDHHNETSYYFYEEYEVK